MHGTSAVGTEREEEKANTNSHYGGLKEKILTDRNNVVAQSEPKQHVSISLEIGCNVELKTVDNSERSRNGM